MNKQRVERNIVVLLFVFVIVLFSFAERDSQKVKKMYTRTETGGQKIVGLYPSSK